MLHFSLSLMNRLNKTGSAIFSLYFGLVALEGSTFHQNFCDETPMATGGVQYYPEDILYMYGGIFV